MCPQNEISFPDSAINCWIEVILPLALPIVYTYHVPPHLIAEVKIGCRAEVVFGKNKRYSGIIKSILNTAPQFPTKPILSVIDEKSILFSVQLKFWDWIASYYMCSLGEVMAAALPTNFKLNSETILIYNDDIDDDFSSLNGDEFLVAEALLIRKQLQLVEIQQILQHTNIYVIIKSLIDKNICFIWEQLNEKYKPKKESFVTLDAAYDNPESLETLFADWSGAPKQMNLLLAFLHLQKTNGVVIQSELLKKANATAAQLNALKEKKILVVEKRKINRIATKEKNIFIDFELSELQSNALIQLNQVFEEKNICLLHGVTGSGKTLLYIKMIEQFIKQDKQVLYLLPEIALTSQIIRRLQIHFGGYVAIYHSKFNDQERVELWNKVKNNEVNVLLGARSALFLPFQNLGLIVIDEEHDASYKQQDPAPRYNARDAAIYYASLFGAKVLLGSGTPSLESYQNVLQNKYGLVTLTERFGGIKMPLIEVVNTRQAALLGKVTISESLKEMILQTIEKKKQVILFQNRRGYNPYLICGTCGFIPQCNHCDVSLTLHKYSNKLHCHYCGSTYPKLVTCVACGTNKWVEKNFGTEKIEEELETDFPQCRIARMDVDSIRGKTAHDTLIQQFEQKRIDILVGTQMVVKGLDFESVGLVGILDADGLLSFADFRVNERAFQLMEQVSGRAGRKGEQGKVIIQAINVKHPIIELVKQHNFLKFFKLEIESRKTFFYPPFSRLILLTLKHKQSETVEQGATHLANSLRIDFKDGVVGPAKPIIGRLRNQYIMEIMLKLPKDIKSVNHAKSAIVHHINLMLAEKQFKSILVIVNVDPV